MIFAGGVPLRAGDEVVGAVCVSGGVGTEDRAVAEARLLPARRRAVLHERCLGAIPMGPGQFEHGVVPFRGKRLSGSRADHSHDNGSIPQDIFLSMRQPGGQLVVLMFDRRPYVAHSLLAASPRASSGELLPRGYSARERHHPDHRQKM